MKNQVPHIGESLPRADALAKVTGREKYATDFYDEGFLWAAAKRAGIPHAKILRIHTAEAAALPGVFKILTANDVPGTNRQGIVVKDQPVIADEIVRHCGDAVALVLGEDRKTLEKALDLIRVDYKPLPVVSGMDIALSKNAPVLHPSCPGGNVYADRELSVGEAEDALSKCYAVVEGVFETPMQVHGFLETENGTGRMGQDGVITLTVSTQAPFRDRMEIGHALGLPFSGIRIINPYLGGGFGGKDGATVQCLLALGAMKSEGRPVKMWWSREESFFSGYKRHPAKMRYRLGADADGSLVALACELDYDTGAYAHLGGEVLNAGIEHAGGPYRIPHTKIRGRAIYTNNPIAGAMRGFGAAQAAFAMESMMNLMAARLNMDPLAIREKNALVRGDRHPSGAFITTSNGLSACLEGVRNHPLRKSAQIWKQEAGPHKKRGIGVSSFFQAMGYGRGVPDNAIAKLELKKDGSFIVYNSVSDMGQGNAATYLQIAGEILCQRAGDMELVQPDTFRTHPSGSSSASRTTFTYGRALMGACEIMRKKLLNRAALVMFITDDSGFALLPGKVRHIPSGKEVSLKVIAGVMGDEDKIVVNEFMARVPKDPFTGDMASTHGFPHNIFSYAAHLARTETDLLTGQTVICDYLAVTDAGRVLNPSVYEQQIHGAVAQGLGYALMEDCIVKNGGIETPDLATYIIPTSLDLPDMASVAVATEEAEGPYGMKGVGEIGMLPPLPAVACALQDAFGAFPERAPFTGENVSRTIEKAENPC